MTDPFLLDQKEVEVTLKRLEDAVNVRRQMQREKRSAYSDSLEYEFQGVESTIKNGIRDVKWSLDDLEETLKLMSENRGHFIETEDLKARQQFLATARKTLADIEFEVFSPSLHSVIDQQRTLTNGVPTNQTSEPASQLNQSEEAVNLLRAESDEQVVFTKSMLTLPKHPALSAKSQQSVSTMVSLNSETVRDLVEPPGIRRSMKSLIDKLIRNRCWLFLLFLVTFFVILVIIRAVTRTRLADIGEPTTPMLTTPCQDDNMNCI